MAPRLAVPDFIALTRDAETEAIARTISRTLFDDLVFEREFALVRHRQRHAGVAQETLVQHLMQSVPRAGARRRSGG